jgi:hypothetical protein
MRTRTDEVSFATFVAAQRPLLQGIAYLMYGNLSLARTIVDVTLARLYDDWPDEDPRDVTLRRVLDARPNQLDVPWDRPIRVALVDAATPGTAPSMGIVADLAALNTNERRVLILQHFARLPLPLIPPLVDRTLDEVRELARSARHLLIAADHDRARDDVLAAQLADAVPYDLREAAFPAHIDISHGKQLVRQRMFHRLAAAMATILVLVGVVIWAPRDPLRASTSPPVPQPIPVQSRVVPPCPASDTKCQIDVLGTWRAEMADVVRSHLDPANTYFDGVGHGSEPIYETPSFWNGRGGALGFDLFSRMGATMIYVQVASDDDLATRCGELTAQNCSSRRFMDGNTYTLTETSDATQGLEVQFTPNWPEVVTVVARDTAKGPTRNISSGDLIKLVQDSRLRLPHR